MIITNESTTILIIDGCSMTRECIGILLRSKKFAVVTSSTIQSALPIIDARKPSIILSELVLSDGGVADLMDQLINRIPGYTPSFFLLTTNSDKSELLKVIEKGITQIVIKPQFKTAVFFDKIDQTIKSHTRQSEQNVEPIPSRTDKKSPTRPAILAPSAGSSTTTQGQMPSKEIQKKILNSIKPIFSKAEAHERVDHVAGLKALSPTVARVLALTNSQESSLDSITKAIRNDHAIALKIIRISNSAAFTRGGEPISTLHKAVLRMGSKQIRQTVLNIEIMDNFSSSNTSYIDHRLFWEHSIAVAICCSLIARESKKISPDDAFTLGLLHDVGRMILNQAFEDEYIEVLRVARENHFPVELIERRMLLVDHASIMQSVLHCWGLHKNLIDPIVCHHLSIGNIRQTVPHRVDAVSVVALANRIVHSLGIGCSGNQTVYSTDEFFDTLKLPQGMLKTITDRLPEMVLDTRISMLGEIGVHGFPEPQRPCLNMDINPIYATLNPNTDAMRLWFEQCNHEQVDTQPNIIVAHMKKARDAVQIDAKIKQLESDRGLSNLPAIILSPSGALNIPEISRTNREIQMLTVPFTLQQFNRTVGRFSSISTASNSQTDQHEDSNVQAA